MKGKWAAGIPPRNFTWVIKDRLAMSERPGGFAPNHRKVRRQEEIIWLQVQGFTRVVSLLPSSHNLQAYEEKSMASVHFPLPLAGDVRAVLAELYRELHVRLTNGEEVEETVSQSHGTPGDPLTRDELLGKFHECAQVLPASQRDRLIEACERLDSLNTLSEIGNVVGNIQEPSVA